MNSGVGKAYAAFLVILVFGIGLIVFGSSTEGGRGVAIAVFGWIAVGSVALFAWGVWNKRRNGSG